LFNLDDGIELDFFFKDQLIEVKYGQELKGEQLLLYEISLIEKDY